MKRRNFISLGSKAMGIAVAGNGCLFLPACNSSSNKYNELFTHRDVKTLDELAETILPATETPGGREAGIGKFLALVLKDCYPETDQLRFKKALLQIAVACKERYGTEFLACSPEQRTKVAAELDNSDNEYFPFLKDLIVFAFTSSEIWLKSSGNYNPVPGRYEGCVLIT